MNIWQAALLGAIQGITEFLPISSSGHLILARAFMAMDDVPVLFDILLHFATLMVVLWVFRSRITALAAALWRGITRRTLPEDRPHLILILRLIEATIVTAGIGTVVILLDIQGTPTLTALMMLLTAIILFASRYASGTKNLEAMNRIPALLIGCAQGFGVLPGISRSGITISAGLFFGLDKKAAGEFSFLLFLPAIFGALLMNLRDVGTLSASVPIASLVAGFISALLSGYIFIRLLLWLVRGGKLWVFAFYLLPLGTAVLLYFGV